MTARPRTGPRSRRHPVVGVPSWTWFPFALTAILLFLPLMGLIISAPVTRLPELLSDEAARDALRLSLVTSSVSTVAVVCLGVPTAVLLARSSGRWTHVVRIAVTLPMVLPPVVAGIALLVTFGRRGLIGEPLSVLGIEIGFTTVAVILAQMFVALPFVVISLEGSLRASEPGYEEVAAGLGASPGRVFRTVTVPMAAPAVASGAALGFARALGEFGATITFAGSLQGVTRTMPLEIYLVRELDTDVALALSLVLIALAALVVAVASVAKAWRSWS